MNKTKLNCIFWAKDWDGKSFTISGVTIYERKHKPAYESELDESLNSPSIEGVIENVRKKVTELNGILKECIVMYPMSDGEHFKILYHWDEETHEYFITQ